MENTKVLSVNETTNITDSTEDAPVFEYNRSDMQWYRDHMKQNAEFYAMIDRVTRITEIIEQKVEQMKKNANLKQPTKEGYSGSHTEMRQLTKSDG